MPPEFLPLVPLAIYAIVRVLKSDTVLPIDVPPKWRAPLAYGLGIAAAVVDGVVGGLSWRAAFLAVIAPFLAQSGHEVGIEIVRGGRELPVPGLMRKRRRLSGRFPPALLVLGMLAGGCGGVPVVPPDVAAVADPMLRLAGFCREHAPAERVDAIVDAYVSGDKVGSLLQIAAVLEELRAAGVPVPRDRYADFVAQVAAVEGLQRGLRALDNRDADGRPLP